MRFRRTPIALVALALIAPALPPATARQAGAPADAAGARQSPTEKAKEKDSDKEKAAPGPPIEEGPVVTRHEARIGGRALKYTAAAGLLPVRNPEGEVEARLFYVAYTLDDAGDVARRPLMFSFNGGPGSSSVWLHLGALGPKRVAMPADAAFPAPPYRLVDNDASWLDRTDLVFIDPVGTGYSRPAKPELLKKFHGLKGDIESVGEFIRLYLTRSGRWASPLYLVGESYGTTRAAGLAGHLFDKGVAFNGILLVSSVLNFQTVRFGKGNDLPFLLYLPTYTATAFYHGKLADDLRAAGLKATLDEVRRWATNIYAPALAKGDRLEPDARAAVVRDLARFTGLEADYIDRSDLRVTTQRFCKELLRDERRTVGRLDSRFQGIDALATTESPDFDPSLAAIRPAYTATFNQYARATLGYETDLPYYVLGEGVSGWDWGPAEAGYPDTSEALRQAMSRNPHMKIFVASGYYDLATPFAATEYTIAHMRLDPEQRANVRVAEYEAGHMMYIHDASLDRLKADVADFLDDSSGP